MSAPQPDRPRITRPSTQGLTVRWDPTPGEPCPVAAREISAAEFSGKIVGDLQFVSAPEPRSWWGRRTALLRTLAARARQRYGR